MKHAFVPGRPSEEESQIILRQPPVRGDTARVYAPDGTEIIKAPQTDPEVDAFLQTIARLSDEEQMAAFEELQQANNPLSQKVQACMMAENEVSKKAAAEAMIKGNEARGDNVEVVKKLVAAQGAFARAASTPVSNDALAKKSA